jgi:hypothetical protein
MDLAAAGVPIGLTAQIGNLTGILGSSRVLRIPAYQRPYIWTPVEVGALLEDLGLAHERRAPFYFVGHIVLVRNDRGELEIADGQQRLATLTMFLAYVRERLSVLAPSLQPLVMIEDNPGSARPRLMLRKADERFFLEHIQIPGGLTRLRALSQQPTDSQIQMAQAVDTIAEALDPISDERLADFTRFACRQATFDVIVADERGGAATVFATMNNRGRALSGPDILKQELLERAGLDDERADEMARLWEDLEDRLGRNAFAQLIGEILPVIFTEEPLRSPGDLNALRAAILQRTTPQEFLRERLPRYGSALVELRALAVKAGPYTQEVNRRVKGLFQLPETLWLAPAVAYLASHRGDAKRIQKFFQALDGLAYASFLKAIRSDRRETRFARVIRHCNDDQQLFAPGVALSLTEVEQRDLVDKINGSFMKDSGRRRVIALRINAALAGGEQLSLEDDASVEHVLPLNPCKEWKDSFTNAQLRKELARLFGNFVLIGAEKNRRAGNLPYDKKHAIYFEDDGAKILAITREIEAVTEWTPNLIRQRHERLTATLFRDWGLLPPEAQAG